MRQHMPVPELDAATHRLRVVVEPTAQVASFSLQQLLTFPRATFSAALMCAGNRRSEMDKVGGIK